MITRERAMKLTLITGRRGMVATVIAAAAALVPAVALASAGSPARSGAATAQECATSGLVVWINTMGNGAAGNVAYQLQFTNLSGHACTLRGYAGVSGVDLRGRQLGAPATRSPGLPIRRVTLTSGATAMETILIAEVDNFPRRACGQVTAAGLRIYPPDQFASTVVPFPFGACSRSGQQYLQVWPVQKEYRTPGPGSLNLPA